MEITPEASSGLHDRADLTSVQAAFEHVSGESYHVQSIYRVVHPSLRLLNSS